MEDYGLDSNFSSLYPNVSGVLPDDSFSEIPYEKGFQLLYHMETDILKNDTMMQRLLKQYIEKYSQQSVVYTQYKNEFESFVDANYDTTNATTMKEMKKWDTWVKEPGIPVDKLDFVTTNLTESQNLANEYIYLNGTASPEKGQEYLSWDSNLKTVFLEQLAGNSSTNIHILEKIDQDLNITGTVDPECK